MLFDGKLEALKRAAIAEESITIEESISEFEKIEVVTLESLLEGINQCSKDFVKINSALMLADVALTEAYVAGSVSDQKLLSAGEGAKAGFKSKLIAIWNKLKATIGAWIDKAISMLLSVGVNGKKFAEKYGSQLKGKTVPLLGGVVYNISDGTAEVKKVLGATAAFFNNPDGSAKDKLDSAIGASSASELNEKIESVFVKKQSGATASGDDIINALTHADAFVADLKKTRTDLIGFCAKAISEINSADADNAKQISGEMRTMHSFASNAMGIEVKMIHRQVSDYLSSARKFLMGSKANNKDTAVATV